MVTVENGPIAPPYYEDSVSAGHLFEMYCGYCPNARSLAERLFSNYQNVAQHMRVRANLTGEEYAKLLAWMRRWHDVPPLSSARRLRSKRFLFGQPIPELRQQQARTAADLMSGPRPGAQAKPVPGSRSSAIRRARPGERDTDSRLITWNCAQRNPRQLHATPTDPPPLAAHSQPLVEFWNFCIRLPSHG